VFAFLNNKTIIIMPSISLKNNKETTEALLNNNLIKIEVKLLDRAGYIINAISNKLRNDILQLIHKEEYINVTDIYLQLGLEQTTASQHLAILRESGLVLAHRQGKWVYYSVNYERLQEIEVLVKRLVKE
jgi:DNA-binding transcriptional ArsR family regulator